MLVTQEPHLRAFWYAVCFLDDLADGPLARRLLGVDVVVWSPSPGAASAAHDRCPHRSARLSGGTTVDGCLVCPYHGWRYGPDGAAVFIPQLEPGAPVPAKARLGSLHCDVRYGMVWVAFEEPVRPIPEVEVWSVPGLRYIREFDEVWTAAAPRLLDNSFDQAHFAFVHTGTFGPAQAAVPVPDLERTADGFRISYEVEVANAPGLAHVTGSAPEAATTRRINTTTFHAPFFRVLDNTYPSGVRHAIVMAATPVDDTHLRLIQVSLRSDTEADVAAADVVAFDRRVTMEDKGLLEQTWPDYELDLAALVHLKIDRPTVELRRVLADICAGGWAHPLPDSEHL